MDWSISWIHTGALVQQLTRWTPGISNSIQNSVFRRDTLKALCVCFHLTGLEFSRNEPKWSGIFITGFLFYNQNMPFKSESSVLNSPPHRSPSLLIVENEFFLFGWSLYSSSYLMDSYLTSDLHCQVLKSHHFPWKPESPGYYVAE